MDNHPTPAVSSCCNARIEHKNYPVPNHRQEFYSCTRCGLTCDLAPTVPAQWRELGEDEVVQPGDQWQFAPLEEGMWTKAHHGSGTGKTVRFYKDEFPSGEHPLIYRRLLTATPQPSGGSAKDGDHLDNVPDVVAIGACGALPDQPTPPSHSTTTEAIIAGLQAIAAPSPEDGDAIIAAESRLRELEAEKRSVIQQCSAWQAAAEGRAEAAESRVRTLEEANEAFALLVSEIYRQSQTSDVEYKALRHAVNDFIDKTKPLNPSTT